MDNVSISKIPHFLAFSKARVQDAAATVLVVIAAVVANLPQHLLINVDREYIIGALVGVLAIAMMKYLRITMVVLIFTLIIGANIPNSLASEFAYTPWVLAAALCVLVAATSANYFIKVPRWLDPNSDADPAVARLHSADAIFTAVEKGRESSVSALLSQGIDPNARGQRNETPLMLAASLNNERLVKMFLKAGADVTLENNDGHTALKIAESKDHKQIVALLRKAG